ncbi:MAG TPA: hypothetical protein VIM77_14760 [Mucilaginibacter sp.]
MKKLFLLLSLLGLLGTGLNAQTASLQNPVANPKSMRINIGTQGIGAEFGYGVSQKTALRLGFDIVPVSANDVYSISGFNSSSKFSANFSNVHLLADFTPIKSSKWFRLVGGVAYFTRADGNLKIQSADGYKYGDIVLTADQAGHVNMKADWKGFAPYLGVGFLRAFPDKRFNINLDLGSYYLKSPNTTIVGTGLLEDNSSQSAQLQQNLKDYRFLPVVQLNFNFKI